MLKAKPTVLANVNHDTRHVRDSLPLGKEIKLGTAQPSIPRPIRVLLIAPSLDIVGGQSIQASQLIRRLAGDPAMQVDFLPVNPLLPVWLRIKYLRTFITSVVYLFRLACCIGRARVLHVFTPGYFSFYLAPVPALLLARLLGKPAILNYHDGRAEDHLTHSSLACLLMRLATVIVVPSDYLVDVFARFGLRATRIYNLADTDSLSYLDRKRPRPVFLHNRGLAAEYNPACTLRAFALIQDRYPEARLTIAHDGPLRPSLETLAESLDLRRTQFIGSVSPASMGALYDSTDIYLMSPDADNMPLSILECFAAGLPIVSSSAGGIPGMVEDEQTGLLFAPNDHRAMAECALRLLDEPGLASRLAANAQRQCAQYSWPQIGPQWMALYHRLLDLSINSE